MMAKIIGRVLGLASVLGVSVYLFFAFQSVVGTVAALLLALSLAAAGFHRAFHDVLVKAIVSGE